MTIVVEPSRTAGEAALALGAPARGRRPTRRRRARRADRRPRRGRRGRGQRPARGHGARAGARRRSRAASPTSGSTSAGRRPPSSGSSSPRSCTITGSIGSPGVWPETLRFLANSRHRPVAARDPAVRRRRGARRARGGAPPGETIKAHIELDARRSGSRRDAARAGAAARSGPAASGDDARRAVLLDLVEEAPRVARKPRKPASRLLVMSVSTRSSRPRSPSLCHHDASRSRSGSTSPCSLGDAAPDVGSPCRPSRSTSVRGVALEALPLAPRSSSAICGHSQRQRKTSPLAMLKASLWPGLVRRRPDHLLGQQVGVGDVGEAVPLRLRAGEDERPAELPADRRVDRQRQHHVHRVADGEAEDGVGAVHAPGEAAPLARPRTARPPARSRSSGSRSRGSSSWNGVSAITPCRRPRTARGSA